jgi:hypothetical protein
LNKDGKLHPKVAALRDVVSGIVEAEIHLRRSSSIAKPLMVNSSTTRVAHLRNCTARSDLTLYPTAMVAARL